MRSRVQSVVGLFPALLLIAGLLIFLFGLGIQYVLNRPEATAIEAIAAPFSPLAMAGLCMAALTLAIWFTGTGILLARQTRRHGADYGHAYRLLNNLQFSEAIPLLEHSIASGKESAEVLTLLARAYAYTGKFSHAHRLLERAIELYPENVTPYATLGLVFLLEGNDEQAVAALQVAVDHDATYWADLGLALSFAGRDDEALIALENASQSPLPAASAVRDYHRLMRLYTKADNAARAASASAKMFSARDGLADLEYEANFLNGTGYGQRLSREIQEISRALREADGSWLVA